MRKDIVGIIANQFFRKTLGNKGLLMLWLAFTGLLIYITIDGFNDYNQQKATVDEHQKIARQSWESNPDKHPHRMAHFGTYVFREQHPLVIFDSGIETYTGNSIFLEAHKQHTANFSEASYSTGLVRFGDLNIALLLQLILPLIVFFIGFSTVSTERENGTLKMIYLQGASMKEILLGKSLGLFYTASLFISPALLALWSICFIQASSNEELVLRCTLLSVFYILFFIIICGITTLVSAKSKTAKKSLISLLSIWLLFFIILPKATQALGNYFYPNPSKIEFKAAIEEEVNKEGDSHDPNDPYFNHLRDSVLNVHNVTDVKDLPFNYSGFIMSKGEEQTSRIYSKHSQILTNTYRKQNSVSNWVALLNPYLAVKNISMNLSSTDFETYANFLKLTEAYRYKQSQHMNKLQMEHISNHATSSEGKIHVVSQDYWKNFPRFEYAYLSTMDNLGHALLSLLGIGIWIILTLVVIVGYSNLFKVGE